MDIRYYFPTAKGEIVKWCSTQPNIKTALRDCPRGDWVIRIAARAGVDTRLIILAAARCTNRYRTKMSHTRLTSAVDLVIRYGSGETVCRDDLYNASTGAYFMLKDLSGIDAVNNPWVVNESEIIKMVNHVAAAAVTYENMKWEVQKGLIGRVEKRIVVKLARRAVRGAASFAFYNNIKPNTADICRETLGKEILQKLTTVPAGSVD